MARLAVVSDSHLSGRTPEAEQNWSAVLRHVETSRPDLVVHAGDLSLDGAHDPADLEFGRASLDRLAVPWLAVPGNHDVGDNPAPGHDAITVQRRNRWLAAVGQDRWAADIGGWRLIGINAQLFDSGLAAEAGQWAWLESQLGADRVALILHKPVAAGEPELTAAPVYRFIPAAARRRLAELTRSKPVELVISGHVHQHRQLDFGGVRHAWAPASWAVLPENAQRSVGVKQCGILSVELGDGPAAQVTFVEPAGLRQLTITEDIPDPYTR